MPRKSYNVQGPRNRGLLLLYLLGYTKMTNPEILELAKTCGFDDFIGEKRTYYECDEEQLLKFALLVHENGYEEGYDDGCFQATGGQS